MLRIALIHRRIFDPARTTQVETICRPRRELGNRTSHVASWWACLAVGALLF